MGLHHTSIEEVMSYLNEFVPYQRNGSGGSRVAPGITRSRTGDVSS